MVYTRSGDSGNTKLFTGQVISKASPVINFIGLIDELSSVLGICVALLDEVDDSEIDTVVDFATEIDILIEVQEDLYKIGAISSGSSIDFNVRDEVSNIEKIIDDYEKLLPPLKRFVLPGGDLAAAHVHLARAKSREIERMAVSVNSKSLLVILPYLNRLSDLLFVMARYVNFKMRIKD